MSDQAIDGLLRRLEVLEIAARVNAAGDEERLRRVMQAEARVAELEKRLASQEAEARSMVEKKLQSANVEIAALSQKVSRLEDESAKEPS